MKSFLMFIYLIIEYQKKIFIIFIATLFLLTTQSNSYSEDDSIFTNTVEVEGPINVNFSRNKYIDQAFLKSFEILMSKVLLSKDLSKINDIKLNKIKSFFTDNSLKVLKSKKIKISKDEASEFYKVHQTKPFYDALCTYLSSGPIIVMILEGDNAVLKNRELMGATDPLKAEQGTLRKMYGISIDKNSVHGSDSVENAKTEIGFFFK